MFAEFHVINFDDYKLSYRYNRVVFYQLHGIQHESQVDLFDQTYVALQLIIY